MINKVFYKNKVIILMCKNIQSFVCVMLYSSRNVSELRIFKSQFVLGVWLQILRCLSVMEVITVYAYVEVRWKEREAKIEYFEERRNWGCEGGDKEVVVRSLFFYFGS